MNFKEAMELMKSGRKVRRKGWGGFWRVDGNRVIIHCKDGEVLDLRETKDTLFTLSNVVAEDWEVCK